MCLRLKVVEFLGIFSATCWLKGLEMRLETAAQARLPAMADFKAKFEHQVEEIRWRYELGQDITSNIQWARTLLQEYWATLPQSMLVGLSRQEFNLTAQADRWLCGVAELIGLQAKMDTVLHRHFIYEDCGNGIDMWRLTSPWATSQEAALALKPARWSDEGQPETTTVAKLFDFTEHDPCRD